jgi:hypothetical protein
MRNERREAKLDGATLVKNSGRGEAKGDAKLTLGPFNFLLDYKHYQKTFSLTQKAWHKLRKDAWNSSHRDPLIKLVWDDGTAVAVVEWDLFEEIATLHGDGR